MNKSILASMFLVIALALVSGCGQQAPEETTIRIGWQTAWATQGQLAQVLKHTDVLERNGLKGEFKGFNYGGPLNEAALAGEVDVIFTGSLPAATLISKDAKWKIVTRLIDARTGLLVPTDSSYNSVEDLKGKTIASPFGSGPHFYLMRELVKAGLDSKKDVELKNLDITEQTALLQSGDWGDIDAFTSWDPTLAIAETEGLAKRIVPITVEGFVVMSSDFIKKHPKEAEQFLKAFIEAYYYYARNQEQANSWYMKEAGMNFDPKVLDIAASIERNMKVKKVTDIDVWVYDEDIAGVEAVVQIAYDEGLLKTLPDMRKATDMGMLEEVTRELKR